VELRLALAVICVLLVNAILATMENAPPPPSPLEHPQKLSMVFAVFTAVIVAAAAVLTTIIVPL
jgi:heme/copper-type cytochrome/quinol oxidase subunit 2